MAFATSQSRIGGMLFGFVVLAFCTYQVRSDDDVCDNPHDQFGNLCFHFGSDDKTFDEAQEECMSMDMNLASIRSQAANDWLSGRVDYGNSYEHWFGYTRNDNGFPWYWIDGHPDETEFFPTPKLTQPEAVAFCRAEGAELASLHSLADESAARMVCPDMPCWIGLVNLNAQANQASGGGPADFVWLDGSDFVWEHWLWDQPDDDGEQEYVALWDNCGWKDLNTNSEYFGVCRRVLAADPYENWKPNQEPNDRGGTEDCMTMWGSGPGTWNDQTCTDRIPYVCAKPVRNCHLNGGMKRLYAMQGYISDGPHAENYDDDQTCVWVIDPPGNAKVEIEIDYHATEDRWDYLEFFDGPSVDSPPLYMPWGQSPFDENHPYPQTSNHHSVVEEECRYNETSSGDGTYFQCRYAWCNGGRSQYYSHWYNLYFKKNTCPPGTKFRSSGEQVTIRFKSDYCITSEGFGLYYRGYDYDECDSCHAEATCVDGSCVCNAGYVGNGQACQDEDECAADSHNCDDAATCHDTTGSFTCECNSGYTNDGTPAGIEGNCDNVDECADNSHSCHRPHATCTDTTGSYTCACNVGFSGSGTSCTDDDECAGQGAGNNCDTDATCTNTVGSFTCACDSGYTGAGITGTCSDIDECTLGSDNCDDNADCTDTDGSFTCACNAGWESVGAQVGIACDDIDECTTGDHNCDANAACTDTDGSFTCACDSGYQTASGEVAGTVCEDIDECTTNQHNCDTDATCTNTVGAFTCACNAGYSGAGTAATCENDDECTDGTDNCDTNAACADSTGSFTCTCNSGWSSSGAFAGVTCDNVDECTLTGVNSDNCDDNAGCTDTDGSFTCACNTGWESVGAQAGIACDDIDECTTGDHNCDANAACTDTDGSFTCACDSGYRTVSGEVAGTVCEDINECAAGSHDCDANAFCINDATPYSCECMEGYTGDGFTCTDIDECTDGTDNCHAQATCTDTAGSFTCACNTGWTGSGVSCADIDECQRGTDNCHSDATCQDSDGSFTCSCNTGYTGTGVGADSCTDIDECSDNTDNCDTQATCTDIDGSFECACNTGWTGSGISCTDLDECVLMTDNCDSQATCTDTDGSFTCACNTGYSGDGFPEGSCTNIDECNDGTDDCHAQATCTDTSGSFTCACKTGWTGSGVACTDIDECQRETDNCDGVATCSDTDGSFTCSCNTGYTAAPGTFGTTGTCQDDDECAGEGAGNTCDETRATCTDNDGSYECACNDGWVGDGVSCSDENECRGDEFNNCDENAACMNSVGSFSCSCVAGYNGDGTQCDDDDECVGEGSGHNCHTEATCTNTDGGFDCTCNEGYEGTGQACDDINECLELDEPCEASNGVCTNNVGSFECDCVDGYVLDAADGRTCLDVDECSTGNVTCQGAAVCDNTEGSFACLCDLVDVGDGECAARCGEVAARRCSNLAWCENDECYCFSGIHGDGLLAEYNGTGCSTEGWTVRFSLNLPSGFSENRVVARRLTMWEAEKDSYISLFGDLELPVKFSTSLEHEVFFTSDAAILVINAIFPTREWATEARNVLEDAILGDGLGPRPTIFGVQLLDDAFPLEPRVYRWVAQTSSNEFQIAPTGMEVENVYFSPNCGTQGCWVVDVVYSTGVETFNTFYIPHATGNDTLSFDFNYDVPMSASWTTTALETFFPVNHPCRTFDYQPGASPVPSEVTACCLPEFLDVYRPTDSFHSELEEFVKRECYDEGRIPLFMPGSEYATRPNITYTAKPEDHLTGKFKGLDVSNVVFTGVIDPYIRQYTATFYLDELELRQQAGILRGTVGVEYTIDTFVGMANFKPTGIEFLDPFATQTNIHLERTQYFSVSSHGENQYTFLEYVNMRLVVVYDEDSDRQGGDSDRFDRTDGSLAAHYIQVTFTVGPQFEPNSNEGFIPMDSVLVGQGTFISNPTQDGTAPGFMHACQMWQDGTFDQQATFNERIPPVDSRSDQLCAPAATMCVSPASLPDDFVAFNIPLGIDWLPAESTDLSSNVFVSMVVNAIDSGAIADGTVPNQGEAPQQMKTTLTASIPVVRGGINIFCDGLVAKTDLKDVADVDLIIGSANNATELTRLTIYQDIASTLLSSVDETKLETDSIEAGFMTLVLKGNASYFSRDGGSGSYALQLEDVITLHIMEDPDSPLRLQAVKALLDAAGEDNFDTDNELQTEGYALNGAFQIAIDRVRNKASLHPTAALLTLCPFRPPRPTLTDAFPATCVLRRDVQDRAYPNWGEDEPTAMEVQPLRNNPNSDIVPVDHPLRDGNAAFMQTVLGASDYAFRLGKQFSYVVGERYNTNGQYTRAYWINPGYEWTPTQTAGQTRFQVSQTIVFVALVGLDEGFGGRRRMLLQSGSDKIGESESGLASQQVSFDITPYNIMAQAFDVPSANVAMFIVEIALSDFQACMDENTLRPELRRTLEKAAFSDGVASELASVQIMKMEIQLRGVTCRRSGERKLMNTAASRIDMMVVFAKDTEKAFDMQKFVDAESTISGMSAGVVDDSIAVGEDVVDQVTNGTNPNDSGDDDNDNTTLIIAAAAGGGGALLLCAAAAACLLMKVKKDTVSKAVVADRAQVLAGDFQFDKTKLMEEAQGKDTADSKKIAVTLSESEEIKRRSSGGGPKPAPALAAPQAETESFSTARAVEVEEPGPPPRQVAPQHAVQDAPPPPRHSLAQPAIPMGHPGYEADVQAPPRSAAAPVVPAPPRGADQVQVGLAPSAAQRAVGDNGLPPLPTPSAHYDMTKESGSADLMSAAMCWPGQMDADDDDDYYLPSQDAQRRKPGKKVGWGQ